MSKTGKWRKRCKIKKNQSCFNCANRISIQETKDKIFVECYYLNKIQHLEFERKISPDPFCGAYHQFSADHPN